MKHNKSNQRPRETKRKVKTVRAELLQWSTNPGKEVFQRTNDAEHVRPSSNKVRDRAGSHVIVKRNHRSHTSLDIRSSSSMLPSGPASLVELRALRKDGISVQKT